MKGCRFVLMALGLSLGCSLPAAGLLENHTPYHAASDVLPTQQHVGEAKLAQLKALQGAGLTFLRAFGNAPTDIHACGKAGIPPSKTCIMGRHGGEGGTLKGGDAFPLQGNRD